MGLSNFLEAVEKLIKVFVDAVQLCFESRSCPFPADCR